MSENAKLTRRQALRAGAVSVGLLGLGVQGGAARSDGRCYYQIDLVVGDPIENLGENPDAYYGQQNRLVQYVHGDEFGIQRSDRWINSLDPELRDRVLHHDINLQQDGTSARARFLIEGESALTLSLVTYTLPSEGFSFGAADQQELVDVNTSTLEPGWHSLAVDLPCTVARSSTFLGESEDLDPFGDAVAIADETVFVGGADADGTAYVFDRVGGQWTRSQTIRGPSDPDSSGFGRAIALDAGTAFVSAPLARPVTDATLPFGAVYVFERGADSGEWTRREKLTGTDEDEYFGIDVGVDGTRAVVAAGDPDGGAVHFFERTTSGWTRTAKHPIDSITAVALSGDTAVVGGRKTVSVFADDSGWERVTGFNVGAGGVDIDGDRIAVQANGGNVGIHVGEVFVFTRSDGRWEQTARIDQFAPRGGDISVHGDRFLLYTGQLYEEIGGTWSTVVNIRRELAENVDLGPEYAVAGYPHREEAVIFDV